MLVLDDLQQPPPMPARTDRIYLQLPPGGRNLIWITCYVARSDRSAGVFLTLGNNLPRAEEWYDRLSENRAEIESLIAAHKDLCHWLSPFSGRIHTVWRCRQDTFRPYGPRLRLHSAAASGPRGVRGGTCARAAVPARR